MKFLVTKQQLEIIQHPARTKILACGRRWGKSTLQLVWLSMMAQSHPGHKFWYVTADLSKVAEMFRTMLAEERFMEYVKRPYLQFPMRFEMMNGSEIGFRSCDKGERLEGRGLKGIAGDEVAKWSENIWYKTLKPMLADQRGQALLASTFNGKNWYYDLVQKG